MNRTPEGEALTAVILETFRLNGALLAVGNKLTKPMGMTSARWQVIGAIHEHGQPLTVSQIARRMGLARQGVQRIVNHLEAQDLVVLKPNLDHKRSPLVIISEMGQAVMSEIAEAQAAWVNELVDGLSERRLRDALKLMVTIRERVEEANDEGD